MPRKVYIVDNASKGKNTSDPKDKKVTLQKRKAAAEKQEEHKTPEESVSSDEKLMEKLVREELRKRERRRKLFGLLCLLMGVGCIIYFSVYVYQADQAQRKALEQEAQIKKREEELLYGQPTEKPQAAGTVVNRTGPTEVPDVLEKYQADKIKYKNLIGWLKIDDTRINYPVMQTNNNEFYLKHNIDQENDKNGALFLDKDCDVVNRSTNLIIYGHHMSSGVMFGTLDKYSTKEYYEKHPVITFDTIYEEGSYDIMYVFRSKIYNEDDIVFKYYQFIDAMSETEFDSYMQEMKAMSLYDTGVEAHFGDQLLTLSTCDYYVQDGRFVVVAKKRE